MIPWRPKRRNTLRIALVIAALSLGALALGGAFLARGGGVEGVFPWQLTKLRRLLIASGVWLVFAAIVVLVSSFSREHAQGPKPLIFSSRSTLHPGVIILILLIVGYVAAYGWLATQRHHRFNSTGYDLAIKEQVIWNTMHGRFFASSPEVDNAFEDHFQPLMLALIPPYALAPDPKLLLWAQTVGLALGAVPLYRLAQRRLENPWLALAPAAVYLLYPALGFVNRFDFHPEALAIPAFIAAFEALDRGDTTAASLWLLVPLLAKENLGFSVAAFGLYAVLFRRRVRFGLAWAGVGLAVSVATMFWLIPTLRHGPSDTLARYGWLGETPGQMVITLLTRPRHVWRSLAEPKRGLYLLQLLAPTGFLALLGLPELLIAAPGLAINLLARHHCQGSIYCQYTVPIIPFVLVAAVTGLERLRQAHHRRLRQAHHRQLRDLPGRCWGHLVIGSALVPMAILALAIDNPFIEDQALPPPLARLTNPGAVRRALAVVPPEVSLVTTNAYAPHLAQREELYIIGIPAQREPPTGIGEGSAPDIVFVNLYDQRFMVCDQYREYFAQLDVDRYGVIFRDGGLIVVQRAGGSNEEFRDFLLNWNDCAG